MNAFPVALNDGSLVFADDKKILLIILSDDEDCLLIKSDHSRM